MPTTFDKCVNIELSVFWKSARVAELIVALSDIVKFDRVQVQSVAGFNKLPAAVVIHQQAGNALHLIELLGILQDVGPVYIDAPKIADSKIAGAKSPCIGTPIAAIAKRLKVQEHVVVGGFRRRNGDLSSVLKKKKKKERVTPPFALAPKPEINHGRPKLFAIALNAVREHAAGRDTMTDQVNNCKALIIAPEETPKAGDLARRSTEQDPPSITKVRLHVGKASSSVALDIF